MQIAGHAALISGGASGLGRATAQALAAAGAKVAILDVNEAAAQQAAAEIGGMALVCDVSSAESAAFRCCAFSTPCAVTAFDNAASRRARASRSLPRCRPYSSGPSPICPVTA